MELRLAVEDDPGLVYVGAQKAARLATSFDDLMRAVPPGKTGAPMLELLGGQGPRPEVALALFNEALARDPTRPAPHAELARNLIGHLEEKDSSDQCKGPRRTICEEEIERHARVIAEVDPQSSSADEVRAGLMVAEGRSEEAEALLARRCEAVTDRVACLKRRATIAAHAKPSTRLAVAARELVAASCFAADECASSCRFAGDLFGERGEWGNSLAYYTRAARESPTLGGWMMVADAASRAGAHTKAVEALQKVVQLRGSSDDALRARIDAERSSAMGQLIVDK
jgi:hypothetical protein